MAYKRGKYYTTSYSAIRSDPIVAQAVKDVANKLNDLANDLDPARSPMGFTLPSGSIFMVSSSATCPAGSIQVTSMNGELAGVIFCKVN